MKKKSSAYLSRILNRTLRRTFTSYLLILLNIGIGIVSWRKVKGIIIRARARWHEYGEKSTKYLLNYEKRNHIKKHTRKLNINGSFTTDPLKVEWYHIYGPKSLFKFGEKRPIVCCCTHEQKMNFEGFLKMVAMATSHSLWRFYLIALTPTTPTLLQNKI